MHDYEASDGVVTTNIDTTIAATRIGSLRLTSDTDVASNQISLMASLETDACKLWRGFKDNKIVLFSHIPSQEGDFPKNGLFLFCDPRATHTGWLVKANV